MSSERPRAEQTLAPPAEGSPAKGGSEAPSQGPITPSRESTGVSAQGRHLPLAMLSLLHFLVFGATAALLPWRSYPLFGALTLALAVLHGLTSWAALFSPARLPGVWRLTALVSLGWLTLLTFSVAVSALYVARLYGVLGSGIAAALLGAWCIPVLFSVPLSAWALAATARGRGPGQRVLPGTRRSRLLSFFGFGVVLLALTLGRLAGATNRATELLALSDAEVLSLMERELPAYRSLPKPNAPPRPLSLEPTACAEPVADAKATLFLQYARARAKKTKVTRRCLQGTNTRDVLAKAGSLLRDEAVRAPVTLDLVQGHAALKSDDPLVDAFKVRPGLDGICHEGRCLLGWQLAARELANQHTPLATIPELKMGVSAARVREALGLELDDEFDGLLRLETKSYLLGETREQLSRLHRSRQTLSRAAVERAQRLAEQHVILAQGKDGRYRYQLEPFTGELDHRGFNLPRQAGTTLVLCELANSLERRNAIRAALGQMARLEVRFGEKSVLLPVPGQRHASLGHQALPLIAFLACRNSVGREFDGLIARLGRTVLGMQRAEGSFHPEWDLERYEPNPGPPPLFSPGQAVMALVLLEASTSAPRPPSFPSQGDVRAAVDRAMHYYGEKYWDFPLGKLFYVEENWHCLAARAALTHHRVDSYERFCIEHAEFKARFTVDERSPTEDMIGAFALAPLIPPPNTATAGVGEALAAAIAIKRARHEDTREAEQQLRRILGFLLRQQWDKATCFACRRPELVVGGFSDSMLTPSLRIDFTQHAWAAIGHGARVLDLVPKGSAP